MSTFGQPPARPAPAAARPPFGGAVAPMRCLYSGIVCSETRDPMAGPGRYRVKIVSCSKGRNPGTGRESYKVSMRIETAAPGSETPAGTTVVNIHFINPAGMGELKRMFVHACGFGPTLADYQSDADAKTLFSQGEADFNAFEEQFGYTGSVGDAATGVANGAPNIAGRLIDAIVTKGKPVLDPQTGSPTGDFYRNYSWGRVPENEQTSK
jgi:hypothetical protein